MPLTTKITQRRDSVDLSTDEMARHWCKALGAPREEIELAVAKVGANCETVRKELKHRLERPAAAEK